MGIADDKFYKSVFSRLIMIFIKGNGQFQVDDSLFDIKEGSVIRISPNGNRTWRNGSDNEMIFVVIQAQSDSLKNYYIADGYRAKGDILWKDKIE